MALALTNRFRYSAPARRFRCLWLVTIAVAVVGLSPDAQPRAQDSAGKSSDRIPGLLSTAQLDPPLRSRLRELRFSPNGAYILLQDESAAYVIATNPLHVVSGLRASQSLPIRFSPDSQAIVVATLDMQVGRYSVNGDKESDSRIFGNGAGCYAAKLSLDGELYACLDAHSELRVFRVRTGQPVFGGHVGDQPGQAFPFPVPYHMGLARSEPFGYYLSNSYMAADVMATTSMLNFSLDGHYLIARGLYQDAAALIDLQHGRQIGIPKLMRHGVEEGSIAFVAHDRVAIADSEKKDEAALLAFPAGTLINKLDIHGKLQATSNPRYVIDFPDAPEAARDASVIDLETGKSVATISKRGGDVWGAEVVSDNDEGLLTFAVIGAGQPAVRARTLLSPLPPLGTAVVSPNLGTIAVGITGQGGVFQVSTGKRVAGFHSLRGAWFANDQTCYLGIPGMQPGATTLENLYLKTRAVSSLASVDDLRFRNESIFSGPVLLSHVATKLILLMDLQEFPFEIHALDSTTGKLLWLRAFGGDPYRLHEHKNTPVPYTDPQGDRVVLGWPAKTAAGGEAANRDPITKRLIKQTKLSEYDSLFEVLDGRSGKTVGAALVQTGAGPGTFDSVFSEGDWLVLTKDGRRVIVFSLSTGTQIAEEPGYGPAISAEKGLLIDPECFCAPTVAGKMANNTPIGRWWNRCARRTVRGRERSVTWVS